MFNPDEFMKCREDFSYFAKTYVKITHPVRGLIPFQLHKYQETLAKTYDEQRFVVVKKFRQSGITTLTVMWLLWKCMFFNDQKVFVVSKSEREAKHLAKFIDIVVEQLPGWLKPHFIRSNSYEKEIEESGSSIIFGTAAVARSRAVTHLVIDEAAFIINMEEYWKAMFPVLSTGGKAIVMSTVYGHNWFAGLWLDAMEGKNAFYAAQIDFWEHPDYNNPTWVANMRKNLGERGWREEILGEFLVEGSPEVVKMVTDHAVSLTDWELAQRLRSLVSRFRRKKDLESRAFLAEACKRLEKLESSITI